MKTTTALFLALLAVGSQAHAAKACEELKTEMPPSWMAKASKATS